MSSSTTNLGLTLPADGERLSLGVLNQNWSKIDAALGSKQYNIGMLTNATIESQLSDFANAHKGESNFVGTFYLSASAVPSDLPAQTNEWKYAYGLFRIRLVTNAGVFDGDVILYGWNTSNVCIRHVGNSVIAASWTQLAPYVSGVWTPQLYDLDTFKRNLGNGNYFKIGKFVVATLYVENPDLSGISTMMQIRNVPMDFVTGGMFYLAALTSGNGANQTIQGTTGKVYFRPNIVSTQLSNQTAPGIFSMTIFGVMN